MPILLEDGSGQILGEQGWRVLLESEQIYFLPPRNAEFTAPIYQRSRRLIVAITAASRRELINLVVAAVQGQQMTQAPDLFPPIDAVVEQRVVGFDFGPGLAEGVIVSNPKFVVQALSGVDATPTARILGPSAIVPSAKTGRANLQVNQLFGNMQGGVLYLLLCYAQSSDGQQPSIWTRWLCNTPG